MHKVKEMMDKMVAELKQQQADEVKFKADCTENLATNEKTIYEKGELKKDLEANMDDLASLMSSLEKEIKAGGASVRMLFHRAIGLPPACVQSQGGTVANRSDCTSGAMTNNMTTASQRRLTRTRSPPPRWR